MGAGFRVWEGVPSPSTPSPYREGFGDGAFCSSPENIFIFGSQNAYFGRPTFSGPFEHLLLHCRYVCHSMLTVAQSKLLEFLQKRALNIILPGGELALRMQQI